MRQIARFLVLVLVLLGIGSRSADPFVAAQSTGEIAFVVQTDVNVADIYVVAPDGTGLRTVIADGLENTQPTWSPDGSRIAFRREYVTETTGPFETGDTDVVVAMADGSNPQAVPDLLIDQLPAWSPDGTQVAFHGYGSGPYSTIYVADAENLGNLRLMTAGVFFYMPDWSPDGRWIVSYGSRDDFANDPGDIYLSDVRVGSWDLLVDSGLSDTTPAWSPDGQMVAFVGQANETRHDSAGRGNVYVADADGGNLRKVTIDDVMAQLVRRFSWSPDSTRIAYTSAWGESNAQITPYVHVADLNGNIVEYFPGCNPVWSPDGTRLAYVNSASGVFTIDLTSYENLPLPQDLGIYVRDMTTGEVRRVADTTAPEVSYLERLRPAWRP